MRPSLAATPIAIDRNEPRGQVGETEKGCRTVSLHFPKAATPGRVCAGARQFGVAPMFERANVAADHHQLLMAAFGTIAEN
jgi:hypothetical protein